MYTKTTNIKSMMTPNHVAAGFKTKIEAVQKIIEMLIENPAVAGVDGTLGVVIWGKLFVVTPKKRKSKDV